MAKSLDHEAHESAHEDDKIEVKVGSDANEDTSKTDVSEVDSDAAPESVREEEHEHSDSVDNNEDKDDDVVAITAPVVVSQPGRKGFFRRLSSWLGGHKVWTSFIGVVVVLAVLAAVPATRYKIAGIFLKQTITITVLDAQTNMPVTSAQVAAGGVQAETDNHGSARLHLKVGSTAIGVSKAYYQSATLHTVVPIGKPKHAVTAHFTATGRQVPISVTNKLTGQPVENIMIAAGDSQAKTDAKGQAIIVLPADKSTISATVKGDNFNDNTVTITVTIADNTANHFAVVPAGKLYFLSNQSGKIDVVKTNLDGSARQTVLAGTGKEDAQNTVLLATRDWKFLALLSKRDGGSNAKLFLIDASNDKLTTMDEGDATFAPTGWDGHSFVYTVTRAGVDYWQSNRVALKSFNADTAKLTTLDQTTASGSSNDNAIFETIDQSYILNNAVIYAKGWQSYGPPAISTDRQATLNSVNPDGSSKKVLHSFGLSSGTAYALSLGTRPYEANGLYLSFYDPHEGSSSFYTFEDGVVKPSTTLNADSYNTPYSTYLLSPSGSQTFWAEQRDGKNTLFIGNDDGENSKQIAALSDYSAYGWYTDNYLLVSKSSSELYIMSLDGSKVSKVSDYYKPAQSYYGYGSGYGGL